MSNKFTKSTPNLLGLSASSKRMYTNLMESIMKSRRVNEHDVVAVQEWGKTVLECLCRLGPEFHPVFISELKRQSLRLGGREEYIDDEIVSKTIAKLVELIDPLLQFKTHPSLAMLNARARNLLAPLGNVLYRMRRMVVRRNRHGTVTAQLTMGVNTTDHEMMVDMLDEVMDEEEHVG